MNREEKRTVTDRRTERGAALVTVLLLATLILSAGGALVLTSTLSATNAIDSTAEMQAYYGAESGLQATINILRGNVYNDASTPNASFRAVVEPSQSNVTGDPATGQNIARLSNWLSYNSNNRVIVPNTSNQMAFDVTARDLDDSKDVKYTTSGSFDVGNSGCTASGMSLTCNGPGANAFVLTYVPQSSTTLLAYPSATSGLGSFLLVVTGNGASIPAFDSSGNAVSVRFFLTFKQTLPWAAKDTFIAKITGGATAISSSLSISFSGSTVKADGTLVTLCAACNPLSINNLAGGGPGGVVTALSATIIAPQPRRILVHATGYGPKGAIKKLEMELNQSIFDFDAPATLTMRGADNCSPLTFNTGSSGAKSYSGLDNSGVEAQLPTFAVSGCDLAAASSGISKPNTVVSPQLSYLDSSTPPSGTSATPVQTPSFLQTADDARTLLNQLQADAQSQGRYFQPAPGTQYTVSDSNTSPNSITFVDGNCNLTGGSGLLVVTGDLEMAGNPNFSGVILVLGTGTVNRDGGGNGNVYGAMVVASFDRNGTGGFLAPSFNTNGGGNSTMQYDSVAFSKAMGAAGVAVGGVREY